MNGNASTRIAFVRVNPRDLADGVLDEILVGPLDDDGMDEAFEVTWVRLADRTAARLSSFHDAWEGLVACSRLLPLLPIAEGLDAPSPERVVEILRAAGCEDLSRPPRFGTGGAPA